MKKVMRYITDAGGGLNLRDSGSRTTGGGASNKRCLSQDTKHNTHTID